MADGFDDVYVDTRRQLRGVAESLIAGPQYRASGTIRLAVRPDGFTGVTLPIAVHGTELVFPNGSVALDGPVSAIRRRCGRGPARRRLRRRRPVASRCRAQPRRGCRRVDPPQSLRRRTCHQECSARTASGALARALRRRGSRGRSQLRRLRRRRPPPDPVRIRRTVGSAYRTVLERAVRSVVSARPRTRCRHAHIAHLRLLRTRPKELSRRP